MRNEAKHEITVLTLAVTTLNAAADIQHQE